MRHQQQCPYGRALLLMVTNRANNTQATTAPASMRMRVQARKRSSVRARARACLVRERVRACMHASSCTKTYLTVDDAVVGCEIQCKQAVASELQCVFVVCSSIRARVNIGVCVCARACMCARVSKCVRACVLHLFLNACICLLTYRVRIQGTPRVRIRLHANIYNMQAKNMQYAINLHAHAIGCVRRRMSV